MQILNLDGHSGTVKKQVETPIHALGFTIMPESVSIPSASAGGLLVAACVGIKITISYTDKAGNPVYLYRNRPLAEVLEVTSHGHGEGVISVLSDLGNFKTVKAMLDLTFATGSIPFDNDETLNIELTGLATAHKVGIVGIAAPLRTNHVIQQNTMTVTAGTEVKDFDISDASFLLIGTDAAIDELRFLTGKRSTTLSMAEIEHLQYRENDALFSIDGVAQRSFDSYYIIRRKYVEFAEKLEVTASSSSHSGISIHSLKVTQLESFDGQTLIDDNADTMWI